MIDPAQLEKTKAYIFRQGRLLERQLFDSIFGNGSREACLAALAAYQNADGGFGNGIEPDLLCPGSSAIGAETALFVLEILETPEPRIVEPLAAWIIENQQDDGTIRHPPEDMAAYPYQPWWQSPDRDRVLVLAAQLRAQGFEHAGFFAKARRYFEQRDVTGIDSFYDYPAFAYLARCGEGATDQARLDTMATQLPALLKQEKAHFPLFSRYWHYAADFVEEALLRQSAADFIAAVQNDGGVDALYPDLPWWRPIFTLDGLILLRRRGFI
ncbi:MAG: hypothetical protein JXB35_01225 [Anaerolineae bacterium]|nr:hypothetical protein [Anaerolineae bacterium]